MPTSHRRLHVTLTPELEQVLSDLAYLMDRPQAAIVRDLLIEALPGLQAMSDAMHEAMHGKPRGAVQQMLGLLDRTLAEGQQLSLEMKHKRRRKRVP